MYRYVGVFINDLVVVIVFGLESLKGVLVGKCCSTYDCSLLLYDHLIRISFLDSVINGFLSTECVGIFSMISWNAFALYLSGEEK